MAKGKNKNNNGNGKRLASQQSVDQAVKSICEIKGTVLFNRKEKINRTVPFIAFRLKLAGAASLIWGWNNHEI
jgi:hypothetical protein